MTPKTKSIIKKLKVLLLLSIIVGTPLLAIYSPGYGLITGAILLAMFVMYNVLTSPPEDVDLITDPAYSGFSINIFYKKKCE
ncbi:MAG: hypothetical protein HZB80_01665 [Deltaproteobacteria bacterium]|nr:hypothetical protein [Deltaproteobacteria bacterium]